MTRTIPAALATALASGSARLSTILEIKRRDGAFIRLTDAPVDIESGGRVFSAEGGYERSAVSCRDGLEVDDCEITGHFNASFGITRADIRDRMFAGAPFTMWWVDRSDPTNAKSVLLTGTLGRVRPRSSDSFTAELRGLKGALRTIITRAYGYECTTQLGSDLCRVPLAPLEVQRGAAYVAGEFVRVATHGSAPARAAVPILNPSFESATATKPDDWTEVRGSVEVVAEDGDLAPANGSSFIEGAGGAAEFAVQQTVSVEALGVSNAAIDAGTARCSVSVKRATGSRQHDLGRFLVEALDGSGNSAGVVYDTGFESVPFTTRWMLRGATGVALPAGTRSMRFECDGRLRTGSACQAAFDDVRALIWDAGGTPLRQAEWENRIYECTSAGVTAASAPVYNETIGATTTDGSAVFTARESWMKHATITNVVDQRTFDIDVTESRAVDDWFNHGVAHWETGANAGLGMEIKGWAAGSARVTLFLAMKRTISAGDTIRLFPGCGRFFTQCTSKFDNGKNYRGHPDIPGNDYMTTFPDAR